MYEFRIKLNDDGSVLMPPNCRKLLQLEPGGEIIIQVKDGIGKLFSFACALRRTQREVKKYTEGKQPLTEQLFEMRDKGRKNN